MMQKHIKWLVIPPLLERTHKGLFFCIPSSMSMDGLTDKQNYATKTASAGYADFFITH